MDKNGIEVIRQRALKLWPDTGEASVDAQLIEKREAYVKGFLEGVEWFRRELTTIRWEARRDSAISARFNKPI